MTLHAPPLALVWDPIVSLAVTQAWRDRCQATPGGPQSLPPAHGKHGWSDWGTRGRGRAAQHMWGWDPGSQLRPCVF